MACFSQADPGRFSRASKLKEVRRKLKISSIAGVYGPPHGANVAERVAFLVERTAKGDVERTKKCTAFPWEKTDKAAELRKAGGL